MKSLRERLRRVQGEAAPEPTPPAPAQPSLADRLKRLGGARAGAAGAATPAAPAAPAAAAPPPTPSPARSAAPSAADEAALAARLGAEQLAPGVLRVERSRPLALAHGRCTAQPDPAAVTLLEPDAPTDPAGWVALDTETSGLAGGTGTWAFVVGLARWRADRLVLTQYLLTRLDAEAELLAMLGADLADAALLLSYNGKAFDVPLLAARLRLARLPDATAGLAHLDLLHPVRRAFSGVWPDCRLASVEARLLGHRRADDLPGAEAPAAWLSWLRRGDGRRLGAVLAHNRDDLISVAALPARLAAAHHAPAALGADVLRIARWRLAAGDPAGARRLLAADASALDDAARQLLARLHARAGDWPAALALWERLAAAGDPAALEALAKHYEHRAKDPVQALAHARRLPPGPATERRCQRLAYKARATCLSKHLLIEPPDECH
ncbi:ribonuclease H-like domain-containing protein [uncultured Thiohalocapsa sp.]|uniref:ribonuclease H-like domain-containing protein n=1 Tax=uncultured Thiohalocapsa sp. TaxID=768990 RepID=UPI0025CC23E1|nr:ribonuclease H-like domain-containing protein [uncultured Thiohalocapsa sp.]